MSALDFWRPRTKWSVKDEKDNTLYVLSHPETHVGFLYSKFLLNTTRLMTRASVSQFHVLIEAIRFFIIAYVLTENDMAFSSLHKTFRFLGLV